MKLLIRVQDGCLSGKQVELSEGFLLLGRVQEASVRFDDKSDPGVSGRHAVIEAHADGFYLVDQKSTNGTMVNGQRVERAALKDGDTIRLGSNGPTILVRIVQPPAAHEKTVLFSQSTPPLGLHAASSSPPPPPPPPPPARPVERAPGQQPPRSVPVTAAGAPSRGLRQALARFGAFDPSRDKAPNSTVIGIVAGLATFALMSIVVLIIMVLNIGMAGTFVGGLMAFLPVPFYFGILLWIDRFDPEPAWAISGAFAWGGLFAIIVSFIINTLFGALAVSLLGQQAEPLSAIISAPVIEEGTKGLALVLLLLFFRKEFDGVVDGVFFAGVVALGFATVENVLYYGKTFIDNGFGGLLITGFLRGVLSPFSHALFTSMVGIGCGISRETHDRTTRYAAPFIGYVAATVLHGFWNAIASAVGGAAYFIAYLLVWVPLFLIFLGVVVYLFRREQGIIRNNLASEVASGLLSESELRLATSLVERLSWLASSLGDWPKFNARRHFLRAVTKLAFCFWHISNAAESGNQTMSLSRLSTFRSEVRTFKSQC